MDLGMYKNLIDQLFVEKKYLTTHEFRKILNSIQMKLWQELNIWEEVIADESYEISEAELLGVLMSDHK